MENKVVLVLVDGMRPDGVCECGEPYLQDLAAQSSASFAAATVFPPSRCLATPRCFLA